MKSRNSHCLSLGLQYTHVSEEFELAISEAPAESPARNAIKETWKSQRERLPLRGMRYDVQINPRFIPAFLGVLHEAISYALDKMVSAEFSTRHIPFLPFKRNPTP